MRVSIRDQDALQAISPAALSGYARTSGWCKLESFGEHSDVYAAEELPEVIVPRTRRLGDYASIVSQLIEIFARVAERDEISLYRDLVTADRDVVRVRVTEGDDGSLTVNSAVDLVGGSRDLLLAAACSLREPQPLYRAGANKEASDLLSRVRLGQTEQGSFVVALLTPVVPSPMPTLLVDPNDDDAPIERKMTRRLAEALAAAREATESATAGDQSAFADAVGKGVSANLCEALVRLIGSFPTLDISVVWARTRPMKSPPVVVQFAETDAAILGEAARLYRNQEPRPDTRLFGIVQRLERDETAAEGRILLRTSIDGRNVSVAAVLRRSDYDTAIQAHGSRAPVILEGDLERTGQRWRLLNPRIVGVISDEPQDEH